MEKINIYCGKVNSQGGSKISLLNIIFLLNQEKKSFNVFVGSKGWFTDILERKEIPYTIIKEPKIFQRNYKDSNVFLWLLIAVLSIPHLFLNWKKYYRKISKNEKIIINEPRDILAFFPFLFSKRVKVIQWVRSENIGLLGKFISNRADNIIAVTDIVKKNIEKSVEKDVETIHNFMTDKPMKKNQKDIHSKVINLAVVGSIQKIKGQLDAIKMFELLQMSKEINLLLIGREFDANYTKIIKDYVKERNLERVIHFIGHIDNIPNYISETVHITIIPSQTESFCRVAMESLSVGVPVIAYSVGGLKEVVLNKSTGYLIEKDSIEGLAEAVTNLLSSSSVYNEMKETAISDWNTRFYAENLKEKLFKIFE